MTFKKPFTYEEFKSIYSKVPRLSVDLAIRTPRGVILTLRSLPSWNNLWHLPGGTVRYRESIKHAVRRVARDELGVSVRVNGLMGYIEYVSEQKERGFGYTVSMVFLCGLGKGTLRPSKEASRIDAFSRLPENIIREQKAFLRKFLSKK